MQKSPPRLPPHKPAIIYTNSSTHPCGKTRQHQHHNAFFIAAGDICTVSHLSQRAAGTNHYAAVNIELKEGPAIVRTRATRGRLGACARFGRGVVAAGHVL